MTNRTPLAAGQVWRTPGGRRYTIDGPMEAREGAWRITWEAFGGDSSYSTWYYAGNLGEGDGDTLVSQPEPAVPSVEVTFTVPVETLRAYQEGVASGAHARVTALAKLAALEATLPPEPIKVGDLVDYRHRGMYSPYTVLHLDVRRSDGRDVALLSDKDGDLAIANLSGLIHYEARP